jgi:hypothetical protein
MSRGRRRWRWRRNRFGRRARQRADCRHRFFQQVGGGRGAGRKQQDQGDARKRSGPSVQASAHPSGVAQRRDFGARTLHHFSALAIPNYVDVYITSAKNRQLSLNQPRETGFEPATSSAPNRLTRVPDASGFVPTRPRVPVAGHIGPIGKCVRYQKRYREAEPAQVSVA